MVKQRKKKRENIYISSESPRLPKQTVIVLNRIGCDAAPVTICRIGEHTVQGKYQNSFAAVGRKGWSESQLIPPPRSCRSKGSWLLINSGSRRCKIALRTYRKAFERMKIPNVVRDDGCCSKTLRVSDLAVASLQYFNILTLTVLTPCSW